jgi:V/A-type H+/Na+-transporting ATPase subunit I
MIVKMSKYSFLIYHRDYENFLKDLQALGVVHVIERSGELAEHIKNKIALIKRIETAVKHLKTKLHDGKYQLEPNGENDCIRLLDETEKLSLDIDQNHQKMHQLNKELTNQQPWGDFSIDTVKKLKNSGVELRLFTVSSKSFDESWKEKYPLEIIREMSGNIYFAVFCRTGEEPDLKAEEVKLFDRSISDIRNEIQKLKFRIEEDISKLHSIAVKHIKDLEDFKTSIENEKQYSSIYSQGQHEAEGKLIVLEGWVPEPKRAELNSYLEKSSIIYLERAPSDEEIPDVPILTKNGYFASLFEPIARLFSLPSYTEIDLTAFFAPFYMMFFGLCLGDAGYGVVMIVAATAAKFKIKKADMRAILTLVQFLGLATVIAGAITGTIFGVTLAESSIIKSAETKGLFLTADEMFNLSIAIGLIQIIFGLLIKAFNITKQNSFIAALPTLGWVMMIIAGITAGAFPEIKSIAMIFVWIGLAAAMLFSTTGNIFKRLGLGVWDMYNNITGVFGDTLSYIRLFALGLSGSILGLVINNIGEIFLDIPYVGWLVWLIFLLVGHTGNLLLCSLGSFVHPMRLTFVEFYKNAGWTGGGKEYKPFKKNA